MKILRGLLIILFVATSFVAQSQIDATIQSFPDQRVVSGSVRKYTITGDQNYTEKSKFFFKVKNGVISLTNNFAGVTATTLETEGQGINTNNKVVVYVKWTGTSAENGYLSVYEQSNSLLGGCSLPGETKFKGIETIFTDVQLAATIENDAEKVYCANATDENINIKVTGTPPFELTLTRTVNSTDTDEVLKLVTGTPGAGETKITPVAGEADTYEFSLIKTDAENTPITDDQTFVYKLKQLVSFGITKDLTGTAKNIHTKKVYHLPQGLDIQLD